MVWGFLHGVFVALAWRTLRYLFCLKYTIKLLVRHTVLNHSDDVFHPLLLGSGNQGLKVDGLNTIQYFQVGDIVLPADGKDETVSFPII